MPNKKPVPKENKPITPITPLREDYTEEQFFADLKKVSRRIKDAPPDPRPGKSGGSK